MELHLYPKSWGLLSLLTLSLLSVGCSTKKVKAPVSTVRPVEAYCPYLPTPQTFASSVTITGTAQYEYRTNGNGAVAGTPNPIRYAEVMAKDSSGTIVQCAETDASGAFSLTLPANSGNYTIQVNSRANNDHVKAYVMNDPTNNTYYSISDSVGSSADGSVTLTASATSSGLEGGPFNILDKIYAANTYLRTYVTTAACGSWDCSAFTVAPLVHVFWKKGFNPNTYLGGSASSGVSFYLKGTNELYILGGISGDVDFSDCDHFDNTIIVHEYGHFIENYFAFSDSPGGRHAPSDVIDPRLAWSEAWANFFQAAVLAKPVYRDTEGNISCSTSNPSSCTGAFHDEDLETYENYDNAAAIAAGEGAFHEFSITRFLWDALDPHPEIASGGGHTDSESVNSTFAELWTVFAGPNNGFKSSSLRFRSVGLFNQIQQTLTGASNWSTIRTNEDQPSNQAYFATPVQISTGCATTTIQANAKTDGSFDQSDLFYDNDFYAYNHPGGTLNVKMTYTPGGANPADLDLIVWKSGYTYGDEADILASSRQSRSSDSGDEEVAVTAPAGWYMINVMVNPVATTSGGGQASTYNLFIDGNKACGNP